MIKKLRTEIIIIGILFILILFSPETDNYLYNSIFNYNDFLNNFYLKNFFIKITEIGNSLWFFLFSFLAYIASTLLAKVYNTNKIKINEIKCSSLFIFLSLLISGIITQIVKHIIGRPRPNQSMIDGSYNFNFFNLDSSFHSFPSGHTSTIFIIVLTLSLLTPRIKYFYYFFGLLVALSRVVVGAHYFTDIIGGIIIALMSFKISVALFQKYKPKIKISTIDLLNSSVFFLTIIIFTMCVVFLAIGSSFDIFLSSLFYNQQDFILQSFDIISVFSRKIFMQFLLFYILVIPILGFYIPVKKIYFGFVFKKKDILFLWISNMFNLLIFVNLLLKNFWGRSRPNDILELGGDKNFSPWFQASNSCFTNCSFVSGDASVGFSLIGLYFITKNEIFFWFALISGFFLGTIRILEGGHFLSDILVAGFFVFLLTFFQNYFYQKKLIHD